MAAGVEPEQGESQLALQWLASSWRFRGGLLFVLDFVTIFGSFLFAYYLRFYAEFLAIKSVPIQEMGGYLKVASLLSVVWTFLIWRDGGYKSDLCGVDAPVIRIRSLVISAVWALGLLMAVSFMHRELLLSRQVYLMTTVLALATMILIRALFQAIDRDLGRAGVALNRMVLVGINARAAEFLSRLRRRGGTTVVVGLLRGDSDNANASETFSGVPVLGDLSRICGPDASLAFDTLVLCTDAIRGGDAERAIALINLCEEKGITLYVLPDSFDVAVAPREIASVSGMPLIQLTDSSLHPVYAVFKRVMDVVGAVIALALGIPVWVGVAVLIKLTGKGPIFFTQTRIGLHGSRFRIYKYRTMVPDAEERLKDIVRIDELEVPGFKIEHDPRVTKVGRFLRRTSVDEIPQLFNVLKGEMSLVGPRPEIPELVERYSPEQRRRLKAKPGITGYQQVMARGIPLAAGIKYDLIYLKHQSFFLDVYILLKTLVVVIRGSGVTH